MQTFIYTAHDTTTGRKIKAEVQAESEQSAAHLIRKEGYAPLEIKAKGEGGSILAFRKKVKTKDRILFSRQLSTLINAGMPLAQALRSVLAQTKSKQMQAVVAKVIGDIESGKAFSVALGRHPEVFNAVYTNLIAAGEASGTLDSALERIANQQEKDADLIAKVRGAMVYPIIVLLVMVAVVGFMVMTVLPQVRVLYDDMKGARLPLITRILVWVSDFAREYWIFVIIGLVIAAFMMGKWFRTMGGKRFVDIAKMRMWPFGSLFMKMYMARFARTATTLVGSGVPLIQMLEITSKAVNNMYIEKSILVATEKVKGGKSLSASLTGDPYFLELVPQMLKIGEESGSVEQMLAKTAEYYEKEVDNAIKSISTVIEPLLMVILGGVAIVIVAAIMLPIYGLVGQDAFR